ncbi:NAD dependent epimerase/dehydratase, putative [Entamoeba invadens IP1]|uniref:NAD dependent epimerase/dehydratase, putative n=1 Tax=Entamoeba invadens IP1 TaxID=370355 RepID=A0A0A1UA84_ENTIV|nr:NAD dependent epimerase/dehydratase, putative [Entamoeba invadens IP1]ELP89054.1 NAD dependent epimerase/dehydratase, putative [Entamoeba invadens IP1]|eukprot:XP_004255825.1 NAD dependent epimerase/dehydratase, putative [Entamoeba invadens IP1]
MKFLLYGGRGWIGGQMIELLKAQGFEVVSGEARLEEREKVMREIEESKPDRIINCAGKTGRPNVDWCEDHKEETIRSNVIGTLNLVDCAFLHHIHVTNFATGCIYEYDAKHPMGSGIGYTETDAPNFTGSFYSYTKGLVEKILVNYSNLLNLRLRMPISDDLNPRSFVTKITKYQKVVNVPNSMSVLTDLLPKAVDMSIKKVTGLLNFVNPGAISHNEILDLYKKYIDPKFVYTNFSLEEQATILKAGRSNNELDTTKLKTMYPDIPNIKESIENVFIRMSKNVKKED